MENVPHMWQGTDLESLKKLVFCVPEKNGAKATKAVISVKTSFTADFYTQYIKGNGKTWKLTNHALLGQGSSPDEVTEIQTASFEGTLERPFFSKDGSPDGDLKGEKWSWTIKMNPYFTTATGIYLIDYIPDASVHTYPGPAGGDDGLSLSWQKESVADNGDVTVDSADDMEMTRLNTADLEAIVESMDTSGLQYDESHPLYSFENLTKDRVSGSRIAQALTEHAGSLNGVYYTYEDGNATKALYIAPLPSDCLKRPFSVTYLTKSVADRDVTADPSAQNKNMENRAAVVWETATGPGPGPGLIDVNTITMGKGVTANYSVLDKKALDNYSQSDQIITWEFSVNRFGADLGEFVITDEFDT